MKQAARTTGIDGAFSRILETLMSENGRSESGAGHRPGSRAMPFWHAGESRRRTHGAARPSDFLDALADAPAREAAPPPPPPVTPENVSAELAIDARHDLADLARIRKRFASANHPDRTSPELRHWAEERMKLANSIIDAEIERRRARQSVRT